MYDKLQPILISAIKAPRPYIFIDFQGSTYDNKLNDLPLIDSLALFLVIFNLHPIGVTANKHS